MEKRLDLTVRLGKVDTPNLIARKLLSQRRCVCASPDYLASSPPIDTPAALKEHACILFAAQGRHWYYRDGDREQAEEIAPRLTCNQIRSASLACVQGLGITRLMHYQIADELADGRLVRLLKDYEPEDLPIQLVYPHSLQLSPRVRAFVEWACPRLERVMPVLEAG